MMGHLELRFAFGLWWLVPISKTASAPTQCWHVTVLAAGAARADFEPNKCQVSLLALFTLILYVTYATSGSARARCPYHPGTWVLTVRRCDTATWRAGAMKRPGVRRCVNATCSGPVRGWGGPRGSHHGDYIPELNSRVLPHAASAAASSWWPERCLRERLPPDEC